MTSDYETVRAAAASPGDANQVLAALMLLRELRAGPPADQS